MEYSTPENSPWGEVQRSYTILPGVFEVGTASHGGIMVSGEVAMSILSPAARKHGNRHRGFYCYEEDCDYAIVMRELLDKKLWELPAECGDQTSYEGSLDITLEQWNPEYFQAREKALSKQNRVPKMQPSR